MGHPSNAESDTCHSGRYPYSIGNYEIVGVEEGAETSEEIFTNISKTVGNDQIIPFSNALISVMPVIVMVTILIFVLSFFFNRDDDGISVWHFSWWYIIFIPLAILPLMIIFASGIVPIIVFLVFFTIVGAIILFVVEDGVLPSRSSLDDFWVWIKETFKW